MATNQLMVETELLKRRVYLRQREDDATSMLYNDFAYNCTWH